MGRATEGFSLLNLRATLAAAFIVLVSSRTSGSAITYVDATDGPSGNTRLASGEVLNAPRDVAGITGDNSWTLVPACTNDSVFTSNDYGNEDAPGLVTVIDGLVPSATYEVYAFFYHPTNAIDSSNWRLRASIFQTPPLSDDPAVNFSALPTPSATRALFAATSYWWGNPPDVWNGNGGMYQANLGNAQAVNGSIHVWIDDYTGADAANYYRTWYDGVGYSLVPEPATIAFVVFAVVARAVSPTRRR